MQRIDIDHPVPFHLL